MRILIGEKKAAEQNGFTIIELVVAIGVISILIMIAVLRFNDILNDARVKVDLTNISYLNSTTRLYRIETGDWPTTSNFEDELVPKFIQVFPSSPTGGYYDYDATLHEFSYIAPE